MSSGVVTNEASDIARETQDALQARDLQGLAFVALSSALGVVIAQEIADRVLPILGFNRDPTNATGFGVSAAVKFIVALLAGTVATAIGGPLATAVIAFIAVGHLASAGADALNAVQRGGFLSEAPSYGGQPQSGSVARSAGTSSGSSTATSAPNDGATISV